MVPSQRRSGKGSGRCAGSRKKGEEWTTGSGLSHLAGIEGKGGGEDAAPASHCSGLAAQIKGGEEGNDRGARGLVIGTNGGVQFLLNRADFYP